VINVAAFALNPTPAAAVENAAEALGLAAQVEPGTLFGHGDVGVAGVAQHEEVEMLQLALCRQRLVGGAQAGEYPGYVFVADRHDDRGARLGGNRRVTRAAPGNAVAIVAAAQLPE